MKTFEIVLLVFSIISLVYSLGLFFYSIHTKDFYKMSGGAFFNSLFIVVYSIMVLIAGILFKNSIFKIMPVIGFVLSLTIIILSIFIQKDYNMEEKQFIVKHDLSIWVTLLISTIYAVAFNIVTLIQLF
jgi:hypothetical protein